MTVGQDLASETFLPLFWPQEKGANGVVASRATEL